MGKSALRLTMLSSKQTQKTQRDMAPDPVSIFTKMRKSLAGKHYHRNNGGFGNGTQTRSKSMTIPQMDRDTAIPYIRNSSVDKARRSSYSSSLAANEEHVKAGLAGVSNGSVHMNGQVMNGTYAAMDENANDAAKSDSHTEPKRPEVSVFEKQGARPKVRKTSTADDSTKAFDKSASGGKVGLEQGMCHSACSGSPKEPPCVEMAQPHFPAVEINCVSCSASRRVSSEASSGGGKAVMQVPLQEPTPAGDPSELAITPGSQSSVLSNSDPALSMSEAPEMENPGCRTEIPKPNPAAESQLKSDEEDEEIKPSFSEPEQINVEGQIPTNPAASCLSCPTCDEAKVSQTSGITALSASCVSPGEQSSTDLKYSRVPDVGQEELPMEHGTLLTSTEGSGQRSPSSNANQTESLLISESVSEVEKSVESINKLDPLDESKTGSSKILKGDLISESRSAVDQAMMDNIMDLVPAAVVESTSKPTGDTESCKTEGSRHCCTCTCNKPLVHPAPPSSKRDNAVKATLTLEDIPKDIPGSSGDSPKLPRTPHIAMLVNSDELFADADRKSKSLSEQDLRMLQTLNDFSIHQEATQKKRAFKKPSQANYSETSPVLGAVNASQESTSISQEYPPGLERHDDIFEDPAIVLGATGGSDDIPRRKAPRVDRSSKPKELCEAAKGATAEEPPPLPPRLPAAKKNDPFAAYPIFDDEDDDFPTHEFLHEINMDIYTDPNTTIKSRSLPRDTTPSQRASPPELRASPPELRAAKRGKTVNMRNRFSQIFKPGSKKKRHSTHGFPDRPLPDIPLNPRLPRSSGNARQTNSVLFGTSTGDIVSQQAVKEGLLRETPTKEEVDRAREQFAVSLRRISEYGWYWGPMSWDDAESRLENMPDGSFLVRDSSDDRHLLSLSFRAQGSTHHTRVEHHNGKFSFWSQPCSHGSASIVEFVEEAMRHSHSGRVLYFLRPRMPGYPPAAVQLLYPISRFQKSRSLQHMCRFVIRKHVRLDHIDNLPLPRRLKDYLKEAQYYTQEDILH
ncbi:uncharacterized protein LOC119723209 [Patiria miniata]|uniref:Suppressor of cytokine signaling 7 n=1 Tax=Patiria miniata TaxID=46514 RepID=A0A913ZDY5_PATMI|nr:uncharacterized protein LOC119723209 [Patiria miniata]